MRQAEDDDRPIDEIRKLRERGDYYKNILEAADKGAWVINDGLKTVYINYRMAEMLGATIDEAMGVTVLKFLDEESSQTFMDMLSRCQAGQKVQFDLKIRRADSRELWALASLVPFFDGQGRRIGVSGTFADITERKLMEMALKEARDNLVKAQHVGRMGSWVRDLETDMVEASGEMGEILGVKIIPVTMEKVYQTLYTPGESERVRRISQEAIAKGGSYKTDVRIIRPDGKEIYCHLEAEVVRDRSGRPVKVVGILQDITERKKMEIAMQRARSQAEFFIDLISHDIGNMNQAIIWYLEMARDVLPEESKSDELIAKPMEIVNKSSRLIHEVRTLRQIGKGEVAVEKVDAGALLAHAVEKYAAFPGIRINYRLPGERCDVMAGDALADAFSGLLASFVEYAKKAKDIDIRVSRTLEEGEPYCRFIFEDNGPGISDKIKAKWASEEWEQEGKIVRRTLGLRFVKAVVQAYGGKVWVEDRVPGDHKKGVSVVIRLKAAG